MKILNENNKSFYTKECQIKFDFKSKNNFTAIYPKKMHDFKHIELHTNYLIYS